MQPFVSEIINGKAIGLTNKKANPMTNPTSPSIEKVMKQIDNLIFPSKEDDGIEHVDMSYKDFMNLLTSKLQEVRAETIRECIEAIDPLTRYCRSKFVLHKTDCCNYYEGVEAEPVVDMLLESDVKSSLTKLL